MGDRVRLLLDVDGVLNAVGSRCPDWQEWYVAKCRGATITYSPEVGRAIAELDVDVLWLTTWREEANRWIGPLFGWPKHAVIAIEDEDMLSWRSWWKLDAAQRLYGENAGPFIWVDDDLDAMVDAYDWCKSVDGLPIVPRTDIGLSRADLLEMRRYVEQKSQE